MTRLVGRPVGRILLGLALILLGACSSQVGYITERSVDYRALRTLPPLDVPPDLTAPTMASPALDLQKTGTVPSGRGAPGMDGVLPAGVGMTVMRDGDRRWLRIDAAPEDLWTRLRGFWLEQGLLLSREEPAIGLMETDWAENRADIPQGFIRRMLGKVIESVYSTPTRDRYRLRVERESDATEIFLTHYGVEEIIVADRPGNVGNASSRWRVRPRDPELEAEMLNRLLVYLGVEGEEARQRVAQAEDQAITVRRAPGDDYPALFVSAEPARVWRMTALALDRTGFAIESRDRVASEFIVRQDRVAEEDKGFLKSLAFWRKGETSRRFLIRVSAARDGARIEVRGEGGEPLDANISDQVIGLLEPELH